MTKKIFSKTNLLFVGVFIAGVVTSGIVRRKIPYAEKLPIVG